MKQPIGLYLHIPFCKSKCAYCDFFSAPGSERELDAYTEELMRKIAFWGQRTSEPVSSVYIGGGTPSVLGAQRLCNLLKTVKKNFSLQDGAEITVEINPESGKALDFDLLRAAGFNRLSVGLQSSNEKELKALGRIHRAEDARRTVQSAQEAGFENISLDLMLGIPFQTEESLKESVDFCAGCGVKHISSYILKIEEGTPFFKMRNTLPFPDDDKQAEFYLYAVSYLKEKGFMQYEISNFAVPGFESRHNTLYWKCGEYIGIGPSAHSFYHGERFFYPRSRQAFYQNEIISDGSGGDEEEYIMLALRLKEGLDFNEFEERFHKPLSPVVLKKIENYAKMGLMEMNGKSACFTPKGFLVSNTILSDII